MRTVFGIVVGYAVWTALWIGGNAILFTQAAEVVKAGERYDSAGILLGILALSLVCSVAGGLAAARIAQGRGMRAALILGVLLLGTGVAVQSGAWSLMPLWYHLAFLLLLVPVTLAGACLARRRSAA